MKTLSLIFSFLSISIFSFSQDMIIRTNGQNIDCKVISIDSNYVNISYYHGNQEIKTRIELDKVLKIVYEGESSIGTITPDSIYAKKESGFYNYYYKEMKIDKSEVKRIVGMNSQAYKEIKKINANIATGVVFAVAGAVLITIPIVQATSESYFKKPKWFLAAGGGVLMVLAVPINLNNRSYLHNAIEIYNEGLNKTSMEKTELLFGFTENGLGFRLIF